MALADSYPVSILLVNAVAVLSEDRFLARSTLQFRVTQIGRIEAPAQDVDKMIPRRSIRLISHSWVGKRTYRALIRWIQGRRQRQKQDSQSYIQCTNTDAK